MEYSPLDTQWYNLEEIEHKINCRIDLKQLEYRIIDEETKLCRIPKGTRPNIELYKIEVIIPNQVMKIINNLINNEYSSHFETSILEHEITTLLYYTMDDVVSLANKEDIRNIKELVLTTENGNKIMEKNDDTNFIVYTGITEDNKSLMVEVAIR